MDTRATIINATAELLAEHGAAAVSTRMICAATGVTAPTLYHHFADKQGLLDAVVADGFARFLADKQALRPTADPVADVRRGWDQHVAFGLANPALYALMFAGAGSAEPSPAARQGFATLQDLLVRTEAAGRLRAGFDPRLAAATVWAAAYGVTSLVCNHPDDPGVELLSRTVRDAVIGAVTTDPPDEGKSP